MSQVLTMSATESVVAQAGIERSLVRRDLRKAFARPRAVVIRKRLGIDTHKRLCDLLRSIPAKPLAKAKLKCGGFFIARISKGGPREV